MNDRMKMLAEISMAVAMALILSQFRLFRMPFGGSVTLAMVPLLVIALRWRGTAGVMAGVAYGLLRLFLSPYIVHPVQFVLDYPAAFGSLGLAGLIPGPALLAMLLAGAARLLLHVLSGVIFFSDVAGIDAWTASLVYNITYLGPEMLLVILVSLPLAARLRVSRRRVSRVE